MEPLPGFKGGVYIMLPVYAVDVVKPTLGNINSLADAMALAINIVLGIGISLTVIFLILGGIQYITSKGDQKAAQEARTSLTNAVIGFIIVVGAFTIRTILANLLDVGDVNLDNSIVNPDVADF